MKGFTLVETLVAITVIILAIMGPFQIVQQALLSSYAARDQLIATALAEEALEYVRSVRDDNYHYNLANPSAQRSWLYRLENCVDTANGCRVDPQQSNISGCGSTCGAIYTSNASGLYTHTSSGNTATRFSRRVYITTVTADTEANVRVEVTFSSAHTPFTVEVEDNLMNWL